MSVNNRQGLKFNWKCEGLEQHWVLNKSRIRNECKFIGMRNALLFINSRIEAEI